jgi:hypothetical protein
MLRPHCRRRPGAVRPALGSPGAPNDGSGPRDVSGRLGASTPCAYSVCVAVVFGWRCGSEGRREVGARKRPNAGAIQRGRAAMSRSAGNGGAPERLGTCVRRSRRCFTPTHGRATQRWAPATDEGSPLAAEPGWPAAAWWGRASGCAVLIVSARADSFPNMDVEGPRRSPRACNSVVSPTRRARFPTIRRARCSSRAWTLGPFSACDRDSRRASPVSTPRCPVFEIGHVSRR